MIPTIRRVTEYSPKIATKFGLQRFGRDVELTGALTRAFLAIDPGDFGVGAADVVGVEA
jgi:hypothetical protein